MKRHYQFFPKNITKGRPMKRTVKMLDRESPKPVFVGPPEDLKILRMLGT